MDVCVCTLVCVQIEKQEMKRKLAAKQRAKPVTIVSCITIKKMQIN